MQLSTLSSRELGLPRGPEHPPALLYPLRVYQGSVGREGHRSHRGSGWPAWDQVFRIMPPTSGDRAGLCTPPAQAEHLEGSGVCAG